MSQAGRPNQRGNGNGGQQGVPPDLEWPCTIYECSQNPEHIEGCDETCESFDPSEIHVTLLNTLRAFAREGMSANGVVPGLPVRGIQIDPLDLMCRILVLEEFMFEHEGITRDDFDELFRHKKVEVLTEVLEANKEMVRKQRVADSLGVVQKPGLLGPDGQPL